MEKNELVKVLNNLNKININDNYFCTTEDKINIKYIKIKGKKQELEMPFNYITIINNELYVLLTHDDKTILKQGFYIDRLISVEIIDKPHSPIMLMYAVLNYLITDTIHYDIDINISDDGQDITIYLNDEDLDYTCFHCKDCCIDGRTITYMPTKIEIDANNVTLYCQDGDVMIPLVWFAYENYLLEIKDLCD